jgi:hypothetical protein
MRRETTAAAAVMATLAAVVFIVGFVVWFAWLIKPPRRRP